MARNQKVMAGRARRPGEISMRIFFADKFPSGWLDRLEKRGHGIRFEPDVAEADLPARIGDAEVLVVRSTKVAARTLQEAPKLRLVIRAGAGTNTIDRDRARELGIAVCNTPGRNAVAVAELAMGLIIALDRRIPDNVGDLRRQIWNKKEYSSARGLCGATLCVLGTGAIGMELMKRAHAFGMHIAVLGKSGRAPDTETMLDSMGVSRVDGLTALASRADFLSLHLPATEQTRGIICGEVLEAMKPGAAIINTSRGDLIDEPALVAAMDSKDIRAGIDVYAGEPAESQGRFESILASHPNVYGTHHIGASTEQAQDAVAEGVFEVIEAFASGAPINCVNQVA
jgi:D-3-phosphoglycerate dehydrogenase